jgi:hypothetical protein
MIKEAIQYIVNLGNTDIHDVDGQSFSTQPMHLLKEPTPDPLKVKSLSGLIDYLKSNFDDDLRPSRMIHVVSPTQVVAFSSFNGNYNRNEYIAAFAMLPEFSFDRWYNAEEFNIKLQSAFVKNEDRDIMLKVVGNIKEEAVSSVSDDGVSQAVVAKTGIASVGNVLVPNPVLLKPYRTFVEVEQPESDFIFRMKNGPSCALFEADGGAWKLQAMHNIKTHLETSLATEIESKKIFIIA